MPPSSQSSRDAIAAGIILFRRAGDGPEYLLLRNAKHRSWGFPKGHAEGSETVLETAQRETREETGIVSVELITSFRESITYPVRTEKGAHSKTVHYFLGVTDQEAIRSDEHDLIEWLPADKARTLLVHPNLRRVFDAATKVANEALGTG